MEFMECTSGPGQAAMKETRPREGQKETRMQTRRTHEATCTGPVAQKTISLNDEIYLEGKKKKKNNYFLFPNCLIAKMKLLALLLGLLNILRTVAGAGLEGTSYLLDEARRGETLALGHRLPAKLAYKLKKTERIDPMVNANAKDIAAAPAAMLESQVPQLDAAEGVKLRHRGRVSAQVNKQQEVASAQVKTEPRNVLAPGDRVAGPFWVWKDEGQEVQELQYFLGKVLEAGQVRRAPTRCDALQYSTVLYSIFTYRPNICVIRGRRPPSSGTTTQSRQQETSGTRTRSKSMTRRSLRARAKVESIY